ncbi:hypothetical protein CEXT_153441 [Caerostris extrusa]|uniref:Uncharacterized protein n=1 Tax=Caerostris extrusa TaxID=172846 RepID=A0AAV4NB46_CAEEX|nr:hypothetical protein CEXT_153441 [Caerostris extrusa]
MLKHLHSRFLSSEYSDISSPPELAPFPFLSDLKTDGFCLIPPTLHDCWSLFRKLEVNCPEQSPFSPDETSAEP